MSKIVKFLALVYFVSGTSTLFAADGEISSGLWTQKGYSIMGEWKVIERDNKIIIVFGDDFKTRKGPDLKVYLSTRSIGSLDDRSVESTSIKIGPLKSSKGPQEYQLPEGINLNEFASLVIHCEAYSHLWGGANLN